MNYNGYAPTSQTMNGIERSVKASMLGLRVQSEKRVMDFITKDLFGRLKLRFGEEISIPASENNGGIIVKVNEWIKEHDKNFDKRVDNNNKVLRNTQFIFLLDENTFCYVRVGEEAHTSLEDKFSCNSKPEDLKIYIGGRYYKKYYDELFTIAERVKDSNTLYMYNVSAGNRRSKDDNSEDMHSIVQNMHKRELDTLFYDKGVKETIIKHIDNFIENKHIYTERDLLYKTGILLYGQPGTGKTSLASALATHYGYDLICVDMGSFDRLDVNTLTSCINCDTSKFIVLLEDIDCLFDSLDREDANTDKDDKKVINKMLQFLDSNNSPRDVIFIATTNYKDKLDKAILRDGRFDIKVEITPANRETAYEMCKSFNLSDEDSNILLSKVEQFPINQSSLQNMILDYFKKGNE